MIKRPLKPHLESQFKKLPIAAQFHPEKSGLSGLKFLFNFSTIN